MCLLIVAILSEKVAVESDTVVLCTVCRTSLEYVDSWIWIRWSSAVQKVRNNRST